MLAVTGATGLLGRKVIASLLRQRPAADMVAIVRDPRKAADLAVPVRAGDYTDPAGLVAAFADIDKLLLISSNSLETRRSEHANVITAAKQAGVRQLIYTSLLHADRWRPHFASDHVQTEAWLRDSGLGYTILRNGWYWENHTASLPAALAHGVLTGSAGTARISWASRQDFADAAAAVLTQEGHAGECYELAGDTGHTLADLAAEAARQSGRPLAYRDLTEAEHASFLAAIGLPQPLPAMLADIEANGTARGVLQEDGGSLSRLIGRPTTPLQQAVAEALA